MSASCDFSQRRIGKELDEGIETLQRHELESLEAGEREWLALQKKLLPLAETEAERLHTRRLIAMRMLDLAHDKARTWKEFERALRRVQRLGYISVHHRLSVASLTLLWAARRAPDRAPLGWEMLAETERRLRRIRRGNYLRQAGLDVIADVTQRAIRKGLTPPAATGASR